MRDPLAVDNLTHQDVQAAALIKASFEQSLAEPAALESAKALLIKTLWVGADSEHTRVFLAAIDLAKLRPGFGGQIGSVCSGLAYKLRAAMLDAGAASPPSYMDDFPSSPLMANADVADIICAVAYTDRADAKILEKTCIGVLAASILPDGFFTRHIKLSQANGGRLEQAANRLMLELRAARSR